MNNAENLLRFFKGATQTITLPDGQIVEIRESNGEDDSYLSSMRTEEEADNGLMGYLSNVITMDVTTKAKILPDELNNWKVNNINYVLLAQRILNHGKDLVFKHSCINTHCKDSEHTYEDNLELYNQDLSKAISLINVPNELHRLYEGKDKFAIRPYKTGKEPYHTFSIDGYYFRFKFLTTNLSKNYKNKITNKNTPLLLRELEVKINEEWQIIKSFNGFSSKLMAKLRTEVKAEDDDFNPITYITCPSCETKQGVLILGLPDFYFPETQA